MSDYHKELRDKVRFLLGIKIGIILFYLFCVFISFEWNPMEWSEQGRIISGFIVFCATMLHIGIALTEIDEEDYND